MKEKMRALKMEEMHLVSGGGAYTTPGNNSYATGANLSQAQSNTAATIVDYGLSHGFLFSDIKIAVNQAFYESSLGTMESNPSNSSVQGLYQYNAATWSDLGHSALNRASDSDQVAAMYSDIVAFHSRYNSGIGSGAIPSTLTFENYIEVKHHLGSNSTDWNSAVINDYQGKVTILGLTTIVQGPAHGGATGGGNGGGGGGGSPGSSGSAGGSSGSVTVGGPTPVHKGTP
ncbi:hypothetical protein [Xanthomonas campestris]|uniref:hypothetical protein n=2 Tax=Xanthomonas TaxID=338 RepID=UPI00161EF401|nr:hypothetical protein [Xanthomonas campestris]